MFISAINKTKTKNETKAKTKTINKQKQKQLINKTITFNYLFFHEY